MRMFEIPILLTLLLPVLALFIAAHRRTRWLRYLPWLGLGLIALHLLIEGYRWQMVPAYGLTLLLSLLYARAARSPTPAPRAWWRAIPRILGALLLFIVFVVASGLPLALPMFDVPEPSGKHAIGTAALHMLDTSRPETFTDDPNDKRELMLQVWYPAQPPAADAKPEPFWGDNARRREMLAKSLRMPGFAFSHLAMIPTHSYPNAPLAGQNVYPVLIFSHGYAQGFTHQNTVLMEELASHGYIVFSIGHPHESSAVLFPDGRAVTLSEAQMVRARGEMGQVFKDSYDKIVATADKAERLHLVRDLVGRGKVLTASVHLWVADTRFVLDQLTLMNGEGSNSPFKGRLDLSRIGVLGMSFGGTTAGQVMLDEPRVKAGVNLDGFQYGDLLDRPLQKPFLFLHNPGAQPLNTPMYENAAGPAWFLVVKDTQHFDFTDFPLVAPVFKLLGAAGTVPAERIVHITNAYTLAFFEQHLKGQDSQLLKAESADYPEVIFQTRNSATP